MSKQKKSIKTRIKNYFEEKKLNLKFKMAKYEADKLIEENLKLVKDIEKIEYNSDEWKAMRAIIDANYEEIDVFLKLMDRYSDEIIELYKN